MTDRLVRSVGASATDQPSRFSDHLAVPNLVLLGDPGAGKTHLFRAFSPSGSYFKARDFLNAPLDTLRGRATLFIDALDEKRSSRNDRAPVDLIVARLGELKPAQIRIACRVVDWLGTSDLAAFQFHFDGSGGFAVLALEALTEEECTQVLETFGCTDPAAFMQQAQERGVDDLLGNPQTLKMLYEVVQKHRWPHTRAELFDKAVDVLLTEHEDEQHTRDAGVFTASELLIAAGAICAARLIADVSGISLKSVGVEEYPTYRDLGFVGVSHVFAALTRRVFERAGPPDTVDYGHRTIAEYLAANFLAQQVGNGLPFERVRALISVDERPASELRGLHAWLAVLLPQHAPELIAADPFGVVSYGDAGALTSSDRATLIEQLSILADNDPWFRVENWSARPLRGLSGPDMVERFRAILQSPEANFSLVSLVLDASAVGTEMPALKSDFLRVLSAPGREEGLRLLALEALLRIGPNAHAGCVAAYDDLAKRGDAFHFRARVLRRLLAVGLVNATQVTDLITTALNGLATEVIGTGLYGLAAEIPDAMVRLILDQVKLDALPEIGPERQQTREGIRLLDTLLGRDMQLGAADIDRIATWLTERGRVTRYRMYPLHETLVTALVGDRARLERLLDAVLARLNVTEPWLAVMRLQQNLGGAGNKDIVLEWAMQKLQATGAPDPMIYGMALVCALSEAPKHRAAFEQLLSVAASHPQVQQIAGAACYMTIEDWRIEQNERRAADDAQQLIDEEKTRAAFDESQDSIRNGTHIGWISHLGNLYFARFSGSDESASPHRRLAEALGAERAAVAVAGLKAFIGTGTGATVADILQTHAAEKIYNWTYAVLAGLDEYALNDEDLTTLPTDYLSAAVALDVLYPTYEQIGKTSHVIRHAWVQWFAQHRPAQYRNVLMEVLRFALWANYKYLYGFEELFTSPDETQNGAAKDLLTEFPRAPANYLSRLLIAWLLQTGDSVDIALIREGLKKSKGNDAAHALWLVAGLLVNLSAYRARIGKLSPAARQSVVWACQELAPALPTSLPLSEFIVKLTMSSFSRTEMPMTVHDNRGPWDATQFAMTLLNQVAADASAAASAVLQRLLGDRGTREYHNDIKHAIAQQRVRLIDGEFRQPTWRATVATLTNGLPANIADLHALVLAHLKKMQVDLVGDNTDLYALFWNQGSHGQLQRPKPENSCRDVLVRELRRQLPPEIHVEPEGHMFGAKRSDVVILYRDMKLVVELKRHFHPKVWTAAADQLNQLYTRDPGAKGFGIYGVFWFGGNNRPPRLRKGVAMPRSADEMTAALIAEVPEEHRKRIACLVFDVSGAARKGRKSTAKTKVATKKHLKDVTVRKPRKGK